MHEYEAILKRIDMLRQRLNRLTLEKDCLLDEEIIEVSRQLDSQLNEYSNLIKQRKKN